MVRGSELFNWGEIIDDMLNRAKRVWGIEFFGCGEIFCLIGDGRWVVSRFGNFSCSVGLGYLGR